MEQTPGLFEQLLDSFTADPLRGLVVAAAVLALATTPIAFAILGTREYLHTRRGRTYRRPEWWSVVCDMALAMGIPGVDTIRDNLGRQFEIAGPRLTDNKPGRPIKELLA